MNLPSRAAAASAALVILGCAPALDWRELRPEGSPAVVTFPCRPDRHEREIAIADWPLKLTLLNCSAGNAMFAMSFATVARADDISPTLDALRQAVAHNVGATDDPEVRPFLVPGMTPNASARWMQVAGRRPGGTPVEAAVAVFSVGPNVVQLQVIADRLDAAAVQTYWSGVRVEH